ncbi:MAG TPA: rhomboid family intramembrane serine protease [Candidatus Binataceae bacterium]|nr:rhomboid family intramembrane serine protease [Candidatus Binataceae bacterium]
MIPLRDSAAARRLTPVNTILIAANVAVFAYEVSLGPGINHFAARFAMVPAAVARALPAYFADARQAVPGPSMAALETIFTSMFLHGSILHVAGNMLYLFIFGAAVESRMGFIRYLVFYLAAGVAAALATVWIDPASHVPVIGASGAIAGVLGAYFIFFPRGRILTAVPLLIFIEFVQIPAVIYLLVWFAAQLFSGLAAGGGGAEMGGIAWWAHVGGFLFGIAFAPMIARRHGRSR